MGRIVSPRLHMVAAPGPEIADSLARSAMIWQYPSIKQQACYEARREFPMLWIALALVLIALAVLAAAKRQQARNAGAGES